MISGRKAGEWFPGEAVGLMPPSAYVAALLDYSAHLDQQAIEVGMKKARESSERAEPLARKIKAMSLFPNIYAEEEKPSLPVSKDNIIPPKKVSKERNREPPSHKKQVEPPRNPELEKKKLVK